MHSIVLTVLAATWVGLGITGLNSVNVESTALIAMLAAAVLILGLPHGALDLHFGKRLVQTGSSTLNVLIFLVLYLSVVAIVISGWFLSPVLMICAFFGLSAWHFGEEEDNRQRRSPLQWAAMVARGGMVIWIPATFQTDAVSELLQTITPAGGEAMVERILGVIQPLVPLLIALTLYDLATYRWSGGMPDRFSELIVREDWQHRLRIISFAALFATANPLISFGIYFCGWHSIKGFAHLREEYDGSLKDFVFALLPMSVTAAALFAAGFTYLLTLESISSALLQTLFIGLSAVAIPHLCLHLLLDVLKPQNQPLTPGAVA